MRLVALLGLMVALVGCASLRTDFEPPSVTVSSFRAVPSSGAVPDFEIGLHVTNPNRDPLELYGIAYTIALEGRELMTGVGNDLPVIEGYGEGDFTLMATVHLFQSIQLLSDLMSTPRDSLTYHLTAKLDVGRFQPAIRIEDSGEVALRSDGSR